MSFHPGPSLCIYTCDPTRQPCAAACHQNRPHPTPPHPTPPHPTPLPAGPCVSHPGALCPAGVQHEHLPASRHPGQELLCRGALKTSDMAGCCTCIHKVHVMQHPGSAHACTCQHPGSGSTCTCQHPGSGSTCTCQHPGSGSACRHSPTGNGHSIIGYQVTRLLSVSHLCPAAVHVRGGASGGLPAVLRSRAGRL
jgi:hypothetical protein